MRSAREESWCSAVQVRSAKRLGPVALRHRCVPKGETSVCSPCLVYSIKHSVGKTRPQTLAGRSPGWLVMSPPGTLAGRRAPQWPSRLFGAMDTRVRWPKTRLMPVSRVGAVIGAVVSVLVAAPSTFAAAPRQQAAVTVGRDGWQPSVAVTEPVAFEWAVAMGGGGRAIAAVYKMNHLVVARRAPQGWVTEHTLAKVPNGGYEIPPAVAMNERGGSAVVYVAGNQVKVVRRVVGHRWQRPITVLRSSSRDVVVPAVSLGPAGTTTIVVAKDYDENLNFTVVTRSRAPGGHWSPPVRLGKTGSQATVVADPHGHVTAAWRCANAIEEFCVRERDAGASTWTPVTRLDGGAGEPLLAVDGLGRTYLAGPDTVWSHLPGGSWATETTAPSGSWYISSLAAAGQGHAVVAFSGPGRTSTQPPYSEAIAQTREGDGSWSPPHQVSRGTPGTFVTAAISRDGSAWVSTGEDARFVRTSVLRYDPATGWGGPVTLTQRGQHATVVAGPDGNATLFFTGTRYRLRAAFRPSN